MGTEKRDRQKAGRLARAEAELIAARKDKRRRSAVRVAIGVVVVLGLALGYSQLTGDDDSDDTETAESTGSTGTTATTLPEPEYTNPELAEEVLAREAPDPAPPPEDTPADALETEVLIEGEGEGAVAGDTVLAHYVGKIPDGTVFDESWGRGEPIEVVLGQGMVIVGWDQGLEGVKIGERRRLVIGSENAYGAEGGGEMIPPDTPLAFEVDIVDIRPAEDAAEGPAEDPAATTGTTTPAATPDTTAPAG